MKQTFDQWMKEIDSFAERDGWVRKPQKFKQFEHVWFKMYEDGLSAEKSWETVEPE
jgi:hypothetical protein